MNNSSNVMTSLRLHNHFQNVSQIQSTTATVDINKMLLFNNGSSSVTFANVPRGTPSPECPNVEQMGRRLKKPLMEKKRRARLNACFDQLKDVLLHSDMQQNISSSKLEKADILEKTVLFVRILQQQNVHFQQQNMQFQQQNMRFQQQFHELLHCSEPTAIALREGIQKGISLSVMATIDLFSVFSFFTPELCHRLKEEVPKKVAKAAADILSPNSVPTPTMAMGSTIQQQQNVLVPSSKANALASSSSPRLMFSSVPSSVPSPMAFPMGRPPLTLSNCLWPFLSCQTIGWTAAEGQQKQRQWEERQRQTEQPNNSDHRREEASETEPGTPDPPGEEVLVDVESVESVNDETQKEGTKEEQDSGMFSECSEALKGRKTKMVDDPMKAKMGRKRRKRMDGGIWTVESVLNREDE